jgi:hypothetical protein
VEDYDGERKRHFGGQMSFGLLFVTTSPLASRAEGCGQHLGGLDMPWLIAEHEQYKGGMRC